MKYYCIVDEYSYFIPEQFTVKAHPALFEKGWAKKWGTVIPVYSWHTLSKHAQNTKTVKASTLCIYIHVPIHVPELPVISDPLELVSG